MSNIAEQIVMSISKVRPGDKGFKDLVRHVQRLIKPAAGDFIDLKLANKIRVRVLNMEFSIRGDKSDADVKEEINEAIVKEIKEYLRK